MCKFSLSQMFVDNVFTSIINTVHVMMKTMFKCCLSIGKNMFK